MKLVLDIITKQNFKIRGSTFNLYLSKKLTQKTRSNMSFVQTLKKKNLNAQTILKTTKYFQKRLTPLSINFMYLNPFNHRNCTKDQNYSQQIGKKTLLNFEGRMPKPE